MATTGKPSLITLFICGICMALTARSENRIYAQDSDATLEAFTEAYIVDQVKSQHEKFHRELTQLTKTARLHRDQAFHARLLIRLAFVERLMAEDYGEYNQVVKEVNRKIELALSLTERAQNPAQEIARGEVLMFAGLLKTWFKDDVNLTRIQHFDIGREMLGKAVLLGWRTGNHLLIAAAYRAQFTVEGISGQPILCISHALQLKYQAQILNNRKAIDKANSMQLIGHYRADTTSSTQFQNLMEECLAWPESSLCRSTAEEIREERNPTAIHDEATLQTFAEKVQKAFDDKLTPSKTIGSLLVEARQYIPLAVASNNPPTPELMENMVVIAERYGDFTHLNWSKYWKVKTLLADGKDAAAAEQAEEIYNSYLSILEYNGAYLLATEIVQCPNLIPSNRKIWVQRVKDMVDKKQEQVLPAIESLTEFQFAMESETRDARQREKLAVEKANAEERANLQLVRQAKANRIFWWTTLLITGLTGIVCVLWVRSHALALKEKKLEAIVQQQTRKITRAKNAAENASRAKGEFLAWLNHELRHPLSAVFISGELLQKTNRDQEAKDRDLSTLILSAQYIANLAEKVLDYSRVDSGMISPNLTWFAVTDLVDQVFSIAACNDSNLQLIRSVTPPNLEIESDCELIKQVLINLVSNSLRHTQNGSVSIHATVIDDLQPDTPKSSSQPTLKISVTDTGCGIPPADLPDLFTPFKSGNQQIDAKQGTGLGLYICKTIVSQLGGTIHVESQLNEGTQIEILLPTATRT